MWTFSGTQCIIIILICSLYALPTGTTEENESIKRLKYQTADVHITVVGHIIGQV